MSSELRICSVGLFIQPLIYLFELIADWFDQFGLHSFWGKKKEGVCPVKDLRLKPHLEALRWANSEGSFAFSLSFSKLDKNLFFFGSKTAFNPTVHSGLGSITYHVYHHIFILQLLKKFFMRSARSIWRVNLSSGFQFQSILADQLTQSIWFQRAVHVASNISWV